MLLASDIRGRFSSQASGPVGVAKWKWALASCVFDAHAALSSHWVWIPSVLGGIQTQ
jgi:hypothetical protein